MKMDEYDGKQFLATVRGDDFAHAGEIEAIELTFSLIPTSPTWRVLDVGCGRGGTAFYVHQRGWGNVAGVDIDEPSIAYSRAKYPELDFGLCSMEEVGSRFPEAFDLLYLFNVFYASKDKQVALDSFRRAAKPGAILCIFDYVLYQPEKTLPEVFLGQTPATVDQFDRLTKESSWDVFRNENLDQKYIEWYQAFLTRFDDVNVTRQYSAETITSVRSRYEELLESIETGHLGGRLILAHAH
jgi:SAM-dependent methyltransferase